MKVLSLVMLLATVVLRASGATAPVLFTSLAHAAGDEESIEADTEGGKVSPDLGGKKVIYRKHTAVSFDDAVVEGTANNPEGVYVVTPPPQNLPGLLKLRPNFHRELMRDALLLK
jgi:hypothetical protein